MNLFVHQFDTILGPIRAIASKNKLYVLDFDQDKSRVKKLMDSYQMISGISLPIESIMKEMQQYFNGALQEFKTPIHMMGTPFQQAVWQELCNVAYGQTRSYVEQAKALGRPTAARAVGNANGANQLVIIIPCHRIIQSNGKLGGYAAGVSRKKWLLEHERPYI